MEKLYSTQIASASGNKEITVSCCDVTKLEDVDILVTSAFVNSYEPTPRTLFEALQNMGISVYALNKNPEIDLRVPCRTWLSRDTCSGSIRRIGCVEFVSYGWDYDGADVDQAMINSIRAFFRMLDIAAIYGVKMETVALPLLGSGSQRLPAQLMIVPLLNECLSFLKRNSEVKRICFFERREEKARLISDYVQKSLSVRTQSPEAEPVEESSRPMAFISYSSEDRNIADNLCCKLESKGIRVWYAPRNVKGAYAEAITEAIDGCTHFIVILSENSMKSQHVLNEIDLAFQKLPLNIKFKPLRIDASGFSPAFKYYLSRQHWMDAIVPPLEERLNEFVKSVLADV